MIAQETANDTAGFSLLERRCLEGLYAVKKSSPLRVGRLTFNPGEPHVQIWSWIVEDDDCFSNERTELINRVRLMREWHVLTGTDQQLGPNLEHAVRERIEEEERRETWWGSWRVWDERRGKPDNLLPDVCFRRMRDHLLKIALQAATADRS